MTDEYRAVDVLGLLSRMGDSLANLASGEEATLGSVLDMVTGALPTRHVLLIEFTDRGYRTSASRGVNEPPSAVSATLVPQGLLGEMMRSGQTVFVRDLERDGRYGESDLLVRGVDIRSVACIPVARGGKMLGALYVASRPDAPPLGEMDGKLLAGIAGLLGDVLLRSRQYAQMQRLATVDPLTGLLNRSQMEEVLKTESERSQRYKFPLAFVMMDLDHFKRVNDTHGHARGDVVLRGFAAILKNGTRRVDHLFRYGGEEFLALLPHIPRENAKIYAERIRRTTYETLHKRCGLDENISVSIGISALPTDGETYQNALEAADTALYRAKEEGRNLVVTS